MAKVTFDEQAITAMLRGPNGPVVRDLTRRALAVTAAAKRLCPVNTGRLRSSIRWELGADARGPHARIGSDVDYALAVHNGTRAHEIRARDASVLHFKVGGADVFVTSVHHPGTKPHPFLTEALAAAGEIGGHA